MPFLIPFLISLSCLLPITKFITTSSNKIQQISQDDYTLSKHGELFSRVNALSYNLNHFIRLTHLVCPLALATGSLALLKFFAQALKWLQNTTQFFLKTQIHAQKLYFKTEFHPPKRTRSTPLCQLPGVLKWKKQKKLLSMSNHHSGIEAYKSASNQFRWAYRHKEVRPLF